MKKPALLFSLALSALAVQAQVAPPAVSQNELIPSTIFTTYRSVDAAKENLSEKSENYTLLSGEWKMKFSDSDADLKKNANTDNWQKITLPLSWQMTQGQQAVYSDKAYPFLSNEPTIKKPAGKISSPKTAIFTREFTVPFDYMDKMLYITIGGSSGRTTLYINGQKVGFATNSRSAAQFNITKFIERGLNRICLAIEQYTTSSLVEDQAGWRLAGVNRDIYMLAQPKIRMRDYLARTSLDPTYANGLLETALLLKSELLNPHEVTVFYDLYDRHGKIVNQANRNVMIGMRGEDTVRFTATIMNVEKWTAETPSLYTLIYRVKREGRFTEITARKVGFRNIKIQDNKLLINGQAEQLRGVNLEEYNPLTGNVMTPEQTLKNLTQMKAIGLNAIRTGGYPLPPFFYEMTDSLGFYVVSTANIDAQGMPQTTRKGGALANDPRWKNVFVDRAIDAYESGKNYPSIIAFALGEQAGNGYSMYQAYLAIKARDTSRPVIYDGANTEWNTDIVCPINPTIDELKKIKAEQPIIPSRVKFDPAYWQLDNTQGAFIDRWQSPSIETPDAQFAELTDDYKLNKKPSGAIHISSAADHTAAIVKMFAPVKLTKTSRNNVYTIENCMQYANLSYFEISYKIKGLMGKEQWITLPAVDCPTNQSAEITLSGNPSEIKIGEIFNIKL